MLFFNMCDILLCSWHCFFLPKPLYFHIHDQKQTRLHEYALFCTGVVVCGTYGIKELLKPPAVFHCMFSLNFTEDSVKASCLPKKDVEAVIIEMAQDDMNACFNRSFHCCKLQGSVTLNVTLLKGKYLESIIIHHKTLREIK